MHSGQILNNYKKKSQRWCYFENHIISSISISQFSNITLLGFIFGVIYFATCVSVPQSYWIGGNKYKRDRDTFLHVPGGYTRCPIWPKGNYMCKTKSKNKRRQWIWPNYKKKLKCFIVIARLTSLSSLRKTKENRREIQVWKIYMYVKSLRCRRQS